MFQYLDRIEPDQRWTLIPGVLTFSKNINEGGAWGVASGYGVLFLIITALIIPFVVVMAYSCKEKNAPLWALGMLAGGAAGNLYDRIFVAEFLNYRGEYVRGVRDFVDLGWWPVFNVADIAIVAGVAVYMVWSFWFAPSVKGNNEGCASGAQSGAAASATSACGDNSNAN